MRAEIMMVLQKGLIVPMCVHCRNCVPTSPRGFCSRISDTAVSSLYSSDCGREAQKFRNAGVEWRESRILRDIRFVFCKSKGCRAQYSGEARAGLPAMLTTDEAKLAGIVKMGHAETVVLEEVVLDDKKNSEGSMRKLPGSNIIMDMNFGRGAAVKVAEFVKSSSKESECPQDGLPEFALVGRSNVGKSSLVNALVKRKELAQTSKRPGKTQLINHFRINNSWYLVDLPGYGYAKAPTSVRTDWNDFTKHYFLNRRTLVSVLLLVDASIPPLKIDLECADWLGRNKIPMTIVFTKCDRKTKKKTGGRRPEENVTDFEKQLMQSYVQSPPWLMTSAETGQGKDELLRHIAYLRDYWNS